MIGSYKDFYDKQLIERRKYLFPPFVYLLKISCKRSFRKSAQETCNNLASKIRELNLPVLVNGPAPAFMKSKTANMSGN